MVLLLKDLRILMKLYNFGEYIQDIFAPTIAAIDYIGTGLEQRREEVKNQKSKQKKNAINY